MNASKPDDSNEVQSAQAAEALRGHLTTARDKLKGLLAGPADLLSQEQQQALRAIALEIDRMSAVVDKLEQEPVRAASDPPPVGAQAEGQPAAPEPRILVAEDDDELRSLLEELLTPLYSVALAGDGKAALELLQEQRFDLAIVDLGLPLLNGFEIAERLREGSERSRPQPFMYLSAEGGTEFKVRGLALGAADYVTKPFNSDELLARVGRIIAASLREEHLRTEALTDSLTGLANYRSFVSSLEREFARSQRYDQPLCLLTIDLDRLKRINDGGGHLAGNEAIRTVAQVLKAGVRSFEIVARNGGDEFGLLLPNTTEAEAMRLSERLRADVACHSISGIALTISVGIASRERGSQITLRQLVEKSDEALYQAKRAGRNRISSSGIARAAAASKS